MQGTHEAEAASHSHAFDCRRVFTDAYTAAIDSEKIPAEAKAAAWKAHDEAVTWVYKNVPLN